jgi:uracil phosphoribosyltransferase
MVDPVLELIPDAEVWHLGLYRDEATLEPVEYYQKLPSGRPVDVGFVLDPMLATGGSICAAVTALKRWGTPSIRVLSILAAPEGVRTVGDSYPDVRIHVCRVDERLNEHGYIVPGLGDAGDRSFNT